jgi:hypothetical protein
MAYIANEAHRRPWAGQYTQRAGQQPWDISGSTVAGAHERVLPREHVSPHMRYPGRRGCCAGTGPLRPHMLMLLMPLLPRLPELCAAWVLRSW